MSGILVEDAEMVTSIAKVFWGQVDVASRSLRGVSSFSVLPLSWVLESVMVKMSAHEELEA